MPTESGIIVFSVRGGQLSQKARLEVLLDDGYWPAFSTVRPRSTNAQWDHVGEGFIKELDFGRVWLRLNENEEGDKDDIISEFKCEARTFLEQAMTGPTTYTLTDIDGRRQSTVEIEARYVPVDIKLEPRESINNMGTLRVKLIDGESIRGVDRGGKSDPYVVFTLNGQRVFKSQTKKKTLTPVWDEEFSAQVISRVGADFSLEVFDWNQIEQAKSLGIAKIELTDIEPFTAAERSLPLVAEKPGDHGKIRIRMNFTPEIIAKARKNTSTFSTAGRVMTQIPLGAGKGVFHGVGKVGTTVGGVFRRDHAKSESASSGSGNGTGNGMELEVPAGQASVPMGPTDSMAPNGTASTSKGGAVDPNEIRVPFTPGVLRVTVDNADLHTPDGDQPKPYVVLRIGDKEQKTKHAKSATPSWNETLSFSGVSSSTMKLYAKVYDHKTLGKDKLLGEGDVDIWNHVQPAGTADATKVPVELSSGQGVLVLSLEFEEGADSHIDRIASVHSFRGNPFGGSPSRISFSRKTASDE